VDIRALVKGFLKERLFREGMLVKAGQLLLVIDAEPFRVHFEQAKARLAEAEASLRKSKESRSREVARAQLALDDSQLQLAILAETRQRNLTMRNAGSREELDTVEANRKKTQAQVQSSRAALEQAKADYLTNILG
jgi:multidrug resistance efflux pump